MIGFLDSGIGGFTIVKHCKDVLKTHLSVYLCDRKNLPYGNKTKKELCTITYNNCLQLKKMGCRIIVLACNTATSCAISYLRQKMPELLFVGTEPNLLSALRDDKKNILVLATKMTVKHNCLLNEYKDRFTVFCPTNLATQIENEEKINLEKTFASLPKKNYDAVVIGCTHYSVIKKELKQFFKNAVFYESGEGVAKQLKRLCERPQIVVTR